MVALTTYLTGRKPQSFVVIGLTHNQSRIKCHGSAEPSIAPGPAAADEQTRMTKDLFATGPAPQLSIGYIDGAIPFLTLDGVYADPASVRSAALALSYSPGTKYYPGRVARFPRDDASLRTFLSKLSALVTREYLPLLPRMPDGGRLSAVRGVECDFAVTETPPGELKTEQRDPHTDDVPVFGLVYLSEEPRGGTLFFKPRIDPEEAGPPAGYPSRRHERFEVCGHIEGRFNRLSIYPGFIFHSAEIEGEWITTKARFSSPRLTQRIMFSF